MPSSQSQSYKGGAPPKYLNDFSKALASEVRILLAEVGKLRDERRQLQYEIAELMAVKSKHGAGGEYAPHWRPPPPDMPPAEGPPEEDGPPEEIKPAKAAWRVVHKRERRPKPKKGVSAPVSTAGDGDPFGGPGGGVGMSPMSKMFMGSPAPESPRNVPAWATWKPNPLVSPSPRLGTAGPGLAGVTPPPHPAGLFGPRTPPPGK